MNLASKAGRKLNSVTKHIVKLINFKSQSTLDPIVAALLKDQVKWNNLKKQTNRKKILIASSMAEYTHGSDLDRVLAIALTERGHQVAFALCNSDLLACQIIKYSSYKPNELINSTSTPRCKSCSSHINKDFLPLGLPIYNFKERILNESTLKSELNQLDFNSLRNFKVGEMEIGTHAWAGAVRYFASTDITKEKDAKDILIRFIISGIRIIESINIIIEKFSPDIIVAHHGIYVPQGMVSEIARVNKIKLMTWTPSYRKGTFIFSPNESYHYSMISEPISKWETVSLTKRQIKSLSEYMDSRISGENDWIKFSDTKIEKREEPIDVSDFFLLLTSVSWDAELHYKSRAFANMRDWLAESIQFFKDNPDEQLVIRIHPAELTSPNVSREPMADYVSSLDISGYPNIVLLGPDSKISTYGLIKKSKAVIIYNTKAGIEAAYTGKPVIVAGEAWIKGKNIGWDAYNQEEYINILKQFKENISMTPDMKKLAIQYAYHFFFRRMIRIKLFSNPIGNRLVPNKVSLKTLIGKKDSNLQGVLNSIEENTTPVGHHV